MSKENENKDGGKAENKADVKTEATKTEAVENTQAPASPQYTPVVEPKPVADPAALLQARQAAEQAQAPNPYANQNTYAAPSQGYVPPPPIADGIQGGVYAVGNKIFTADGVELKRTEQ